MLKFEKSHYLCNTNHTEQIYIVELLVIFNPIVFIYDIKLCRTNHSNEPKETLRWNTYIIWWRKYIDHFFILMVLSEVSQFRGNPTTIFTVNDRVSWTHFPHSVFNSANNKAAGLTVPGCSVIWLVLFHHSAITSLKPSMGEWSLGVIPAGSFFGNGQ